MFKRNSKGFTLIEILVVISIIGVLATIITINFRSVREQSRCAKRRVDIISVQAPLEAYYDANKVYPIPVGTWWGACPTFGSHDVTGSNGWIPNLAPTYIVRLPSDPNPSSTDRCYLYRSNGNQYKVLAYRPYQDGCTLGDSKDMLYDPARSGTAWMVCSGEPACSTW